MTITAPPEPLSSAALTAISPLRPHAVYQRTRTGLPPLREYVGEIWRRRPFVWHLARTQLKAENYDTAAGQLWIILNPLLMAAVYMFVRTIFRPPSGMDQKDVIDHLIMGVFLFKFVSSSLMLGARSIYMNRQMVLNTAFPRAIFPIASTTQAFMELVPTMGVYFLVHWYLDQPFTDALVWMPVYLLTFTIFSLGLALFFAPLCVLYRDTAGIVPYLTKVWLFTSPVMYSVAEIPPNLLPYLEWLNPAFAWYAAFEQMFDGQMPDLKYLWMSLGWMTATFLAGAALFLFKERRFAARL